MAPKLMNGKKRTRTIASNRLLELRERGRRNGGLWLTLEEVSAITGISSAMISLHENHKRPMSEEDAQAYAKIYKVQTHQIFKGLTAKIKTA